MTITAVLSLFTLLTLSSLLYFLAKRLKVPYTVFLVLVGILLVFLAKLVPPLEFLFHLELTPELLFFGFLPVLIFESAFQMNIRRIVENIWSISAIAIMGLLISTIAIAFGLYFLLPLVGIELPFILALLFGSIISSTDPVAGLALFKESGAPKRLTLIFEGESLFNDGPAVALFLIFLGIAQHGFFGSATIMEGIFMFFVMMIGGALLGIIVGLIFSKLLRYTRSNEFVSVTILVVSAHVTFVLGELIGIYGLFGAHFHVSAIIATVVCALFLGNYSRHILSPKSDEYLEKSIEHLAFMANSLVFILIGMLFATSAIPLTLLWLPIVVTIVVVAISRAFSMYSVFVPLNKLSVEEPIPTSWIHMLAWGSIRGSLVIIMILLIPETYSPENWQYVFSPRELLLALATGCILATLFIKALTIKTVLRKLNIQENNTINEAYKVDLEVYTLLTELHRLTEQQSKGFLREDFYISMKDEVENKLKDLYAQRKELIKEGGEHIFEHSLRIAAIQVERKYLQALYVNNEISEKEYRHIYGKISLQKEKILTYHEQDINPSEYQDRKDVFDRMMKFLHRLQGISDDLTDEEKLKYYRAQTIISRKVIKTLTTMQTQYGQPVFLDSIFEGVISTYTDYKEQSKEKLNTILENDREKFEPVLEFLSQKSLEAAKNKSLNYLSEKGFIHH